MFFARRPACPVRIERPVAEIRAARYKVLVSARLRPICVSFVGLVGPFPRQGRRLFCSGSPAASGRLYSLDVDMSSPDGAAVHAGVAQHPERGRRDLYGATISFGPAVFQVVRNRDLGSARRLVNTRPAPDRLRAVAQPALLYMDAGRWFRRSRVEPVR